MSLSEYEKIKVKQKAGTIISSTDSDSYIYDHLYGRRYSLDDINSTFKNANVKLLQYEIDMLTIKGQFQITKRTIMVVGKSFFKDKVICYENALKFGILCLMWGYASQGYGLYRIGKMFEDPGVPERFSNNILQSYINLQNHDIESAYLSWEDKNHIRGLGESFFTKILYFLSKIIDISNPKVLIKDSFTSMNAAALFGIKRLANIGVAEFIDYITVLEIAANELNVNAEIIEEFLFSNSKKISSQINESELLEYTFRLSSNYLDEFNPPTVLHKDLYYCECVPDSQNNYLIMLVADGKPSAEIEEMSYDSKVGNVKENFYSKQRNKIIIDANIEANKYHQTVPTYILTTGFGAVPISTNIPYYNIPGEKAINNSRYWDLYIDSIKSLLPNSEEGKTIRVSIVYYAGKSRRMFRDGIFDLIKTLSEDNCLKQKYDIHFCMYGCRQHPKNIWNGNWGNLNGIFKYLASKDFQNLNIMGKNWLEENFNISPFFMYF